MEKRKEGMRKWKGNGVEIEGKEGKRRKRKEIWPTVDVHKINGEGRKLVSRERNLFSVQTNNSHKP